jgi:hypothetical protein
MPPSVNHSTAEAVIRGKRIYLGFGLVKELEIKTIAAIVHARQADGEFSSIEEFVKRAQVSLDQLVLLVRVGGFKFAGQSKKELLWKAHFLLGHAKKSRPTKLLFDADTKNYELPDWFSAVQSVFADRVGKGGEKTDSHSCRTSGKDWPDSDHRRLPDHREGNQNQQRSTDALWYFHRPQRRVA